ncbi:MAG: patatin [Cereibacter sphaeroides]|uniref:Patatin n=1 Tax=Cereibacter sphaeroides TaxID=1063 RepID=A0A2W5SA55_CERSP|nr:MAG: patatin [Cereibacter sphaeroides]
MSQTHPTRPGAYNRRVALVLQGGGALGSYQAGVYDALADSPYQPDWVAGISIGAINAAIIAGNDPKDRVDQLRRFWERITPWPFDWPAFNDRTGALRQQLSAQTTMMLGQPGFFAPRPLWSWFAATTPISYYDTAALKTTLEELVDFERINAPEGTRLSVGAVNVRTGRFAYFDSDNIKIRPEHIIASGALPPGFPAVEIDGEMYWDGGLVSNTPLAHVIDHFPRQSLLTFQVDLFQGYGRVPDTLDEVAEREKDIRYSSRTRIVTDYIAEKHEVRHAINDLLAKLPPEVACLPEAQKLDRLACVSEMDIVQLIYRPFGPQGSSKDYEFSRATMEARWKEGKSDAKATLKAAPWLEPKPKEIGVRMFDVMHEILTKRKNPLAAPLDEIIGDAVDEPADVAGGTVGEKPQRKRVVR